LELDPRSPFRLAVLGALLACCPNRRYRDGSRARELCTEACELTGYSNAECLTWLAAACAEQGDFEAAVSFQKEALSIAGEDDDTEGMLFAQGNYERGIPWRMDAPKWHQRFF